MSVLKFCKKVILLIHNALFFCDVFSFFVMNCYFNPKNLKITRG